MRVTELLTALGFIDAQWFTAEACARGTRVHRAIELDDADNLDESTCDAETMAHVASWRQWKAAAGLVVTASEVEIRGAGYVGHPDTLGTIDGKPVIVERKTGAPCDWHRLQVCLYALAAPFPTRPRPILVYTQADGRIARQGPEITTADFEAARACAALGIWRGRKK